MDVIGIEFLPAGNSFLVILETNVPFASYTLSTTDSALKGKEKDTTLFLHNIEYG
jgi:hypothetical protein